MQQRHELAICKEMLSNSDMELTEQRRLREQTDSEMQRWKVELNKQRDKVTELEGRLTDMSFGKIEDATRFENDHWRDEPNRQQLENDKQESELKSVLTKLEGSIKKCCGLDNRLLMLKKQNSRRKR